jgi:drug/metabolite transporter (DMT)-like permease
MARPDLMTLRAADTPEDDNPPLIPEAVSATGLRPLPRPRSRFAIRQENAIQWWDRAPDNLRGSLLMISAFFGFAVMMSSIKAIGTAVPLPQVLVIRQIIMTVLLLPLFMHDMKGALETSHLGLHILRGFCSLGAMLFGFTALVHVPLADVTALGFSQVLFVTVAAVLLLKEQVGPRRWAATAIGFVGVLIMLRPGGEGTNVYALLALIGAGFGAGITITVRMLAQSEKTATIMLYQAVVLMAALLPPTVEWWVPPTAWEWFLMLLIGVFGTMGQWLVTKAFQVGEAAALAPLDFVRLLIATAMGFFLFNEIPDLMTALGASIVVGATIYTMRRNAQRRSPLPPTTS